MPLVPLSFFPSIILPNSVFRFYYPAIDVAILALLCVAAGIVRGTRWRVHLRWVVPYILMDFLASADRVVYSAHAWWGVSVPQSILSVAGDCDYAADAAALYGTFMLCLTFRQVVRGTLQEELPGKSPRPIDKGAWPPPPARPGPGGLSP